MGLRQLVIGVIIVLLFMICIFYFTTGFLSINNPNSLIFTDSKYNQKMNNTIDSLNSTLGSSTSEISKSLSGLENDTHPGASTYLFLIFESAFSIPKAFGTVVVNGIGILNNFIFAEIFGSNSAFIITIIMAIITFTVILYIIRAIRTGQE